MNFTWLNVASAGRAMPTLLLIASLLSAWSTFNVHRPMNRGSRRGFVSFFAGWLTGELALHHIAWQAAVTIVMIAFGALARWPGWLGLAILFASWSALALSYQSARAAEHCVEDALCAALGRTYRDALRESSRERVTQTIAWREIAMPFPMRDPRVERLRDIPYASPKGRPLLLDVYRPREPVPGALAPVLLQVHGGGWVVGSKNEQGIPLMLRMAAHGWLCASIDYRLSPRATFPEHAVDVKQAIAWLREHAGAYGGDPGFIVITGGSAGGHLASLAALTANDPELQPGFEDVDTTLRGCVSFYGVYDFTDPESTYRNRGLRRLLERWVMKEPLARARERFERASPVHRVSGEAPPFFVVHGDRDTLVPVAQARAFVGALRSVAREPVVYAEIRGAQHAFEIFPSLRSVLAIDGVERFLFWLHDRFLAAERAGDGLCAGAPASAAPELASSEEPLPCPTST